MVKPNYAIVEWAGRWALMLILGTLALFVNGGIHSSTPRGSGATKGAQSPRRDTPPSAEALLVQSCLHCHDLSAIAAQNKSVAEWRHTINVMIWRGAQVLPEEVEPLAVHLARLSATDVPVVEAQLRALPEGEGRRLIETSCLGCHDVKLIVARRRSRREWEATMEKMLDLGTPISEPDARRLTEYLVAHYGVASE